MIFFICLIILIIYNLLKIKNYNENLIFDAGFNYFYNIEILYIKLYKKNQNIKKIYIYII